jgi:glycosyltransferase involved in cell wall biosynthesis
MKIAFLHMTMGITSRGSEVVVDTLASELAKKHDVLVVQSGRVDQKPYTVERVFTQEHAPSVAPRSILDKLLFRLHLDAESGVVAKFTSEAEPTLTKFDPDIIVAVNGPLQLKLLKQIGLRAKLVVFGHAGIGYHDRDNLKAKPDLFIALTPSAFDWAKNIARSKTRVVYIPNPIGTTKAKRVKLSVSAPVVLTVAALSKYKNVDKVLSAIKNLPYSWLLIGDGEERIVIEDKLSKLANDFRWIREIDQSEIMGYYQSTDVFCFIPDPQEAFGMVYLEAMSAGLPIVTSDDPIRRQLIGEQGIYVDPQNEEAVTAGIQKATTLGKLDYSKELENYSLKLVVAQIEKEFHDLIS